MQAHILLPLSLEQIEGVRRSAYSPWAKYFQGAHLIANSTLQNLGRKLYGACHYLSPRLKSLRLGNTSWVPTPSLRLDGRTNAFTVSNS